MIELGQLRRWQPDYVELERSPIFIILNLMDKLELELSGGNTDMRAWRMLLEDGSIDWAYEIDLYDMSEELDETR